MFNPEQPHTYPRRILLAACGLTPQIVTETLYALAVALDRWHEHDAALLDGRRGRPAGRRSDVL